jgi:ribonuclease P protein component
MVKPGTLKQRSQFQRVYELGKTKVNSFLVVRLIENNLEISRFGFSITKRLGKAVIRNRIRRLLKEIVRVTEIKTGFDVVIIARDRAVDADYHQLKSSVLYLLGKHNIILHNEESGAKDN